MKFKLPEMEDELDKSPARLREVVAFCDWTHKKIAGKDFVVTCVWGDASGRTSATHAEHRAVDGRIEMYGDFGRPAWWVTEEQANVIAEIMNNRFPISAAMKTCIVHRAEWRDEFNHELFGPLHFHLQISRSQAQIDQK